MSHILGVKTESLEPCDTTRQKTVKRNRWVKDFSASDNRLLSALERESTAKRGSAAASGIGFKVAL